MVGTPTIGLKSHPPRAAPTIPTTTLSTRRSRVRMSQLAAHPISPPATSQIMMFTDVCPFKFLPAVETTRLERMRLFAAVRTKGAAAQNGWHIARILRGPWST
jgi:hypothetical protein